MATPVPSLIADADTSAAGELARAALTKEAAEAREHAKAASDKMRERADAWGKGLTTLGTAAVGYVGITKAVDIFPIPPGWGWLSALGLVLLVVMAASALMVGWRLSHVGRPMQMKSNPADIDDLSKAERAAVSGLYGEVARLNGCELLAEYDQIGQGIAGGYEKLTPGDPPPAIPFSRATQIRAEVQAAQQRAATLVVRHRLTNATTGNLTLVLLAVFLAAAIGVGVTTDKLDSIRSAETPTITEQLATITACGEAQGALDTHPQLTASLPSECVGEQ